MDRRRPLMDSELEHARKLGADLQQIWTAETTTARDRKRLLRCLIEEVQIRSETDWHLVRIIWKGGATTDREVPRFTPGGRAHATSLETIELIRRLATEFDDAQIARILNRQGRRSGNDLAFTKQSVSSTRHRHEIPAAATRHRRRHWPGQSPARAGLRQ